MRAGQHPHDDEHFVARMDRRLALRLLRYALPHRRLMALALVLVLFVTVLDLAGPLIVRHVIDGPLTAAVGPGPSAASIDPALRSIAGWAGVYLAVIAAYVVVRYAQSMLMSRLGKRVMFDVRMEIFRHLQRMPLAFFDRSPIGRLVTRVSNDVESLDQLFASGLVSFAADVFVLAGITIILFAVNASLALITLAAVPVLLAITFVFRFYARKFYREQRTHLSRLNAFTQESIQGMDVIQLFVREEDNKRRFSSISRKYLDAFLKTTICYALYFPGLELVSAAAQIGILLWGGHLIGTGEISFGDFFLFWRLLHRFFNPIRDMADRYNVLQSALTSAERIFTILDAPESIRTSPDAIRPTALRGEIELRGVSFSYTGEERALRDVDLRVQAGETVAIVGATGAGKSTVVNLLLRFYEPQEGAILVDDVPLERYDKHALRSRMALVPQDPFLFTTSIRENIRLGNDSIDEERVRTAARRVGADRFIDKLPAGYDQELAERGATLSMGEKQLLSFARALAHDPDILVLDEATAHVDTETEQLIERALAELLPGRTSIVIAHRLSTVRRADRILVFHKGELREQGTHRDLLDKQGIYYRLYQLQFSEGASRGDASGNPP